MDDIPSVIGTAGPIAGLLVFMLAIIRLIAAVYSSTANDRVGTYREHAEIWRERENFATQKLDRQVTVIEALTDELKVSRLESQNERLRIEGKIDGLAARWETIEWAFKEATGHARDPG